MNAKQFLENPKSVVSFDPELAKAYSLEDGIILSTLIQLSSTSPYGCVTLNAKELYNQYFAFWDYHHFVDVFVPLIQAKLILFNHNMEKHIQYAPNYEMIYQGIMWTRNK